MEVEDESLRTNNQKKIYQSFQNNNIEEEDDE